MNEKLRSLLKYQADIKSKLESTDIPAKHTNRPVQYKQFLSRELEAVSAKISGIKEALPAKS